MRSALLVKADLPKLIPRNVEDHQLPEEDGHFFEGESIFRVDFLAFLHQKIEIVPEEVAFVGDVV